ncbi:MAG: GNAT family N-acetyltransferase, partial [Eubacterium sp.]|nr:GNAT family N-acetyltransferase [Eubacterium sp.]
MKRGTIELKCDDLTLRRYTDKDINVIYEKLGCDAEMMRYTGWNPYFPLQAATDFINEIICGYDEDETDYSWIIVYKENVSGIIGAYDYNENENSIEIGYSIFKEFWGKGIATQALNVVCDYLLNHENISILKAWSAAENTASKKVLENAGFLKTKIKESAINVNGEGFDQVFFEKSGCRRFMAFAHFDDLKPTWEIVKFDECIENIPCVSKNSWEGNPLDKNTVLTFCIKPSEYVYYLQKIDKVIVSDRFLSDEKDLTEAFGAEVSNHCVIEANKKVVRSFLYEMVIGECLVYRYFEITVECKNLGENMYSCTASPVKEVKRYVFYGNSVFIENRDYTKKACKIEDLFYETAYDTLCDADKEFSFSLYKAFVNNVKLLHKSKIVHALSFVKKRYQKFGIKVFAEICQMVFESRPIPEDTPKRIVKEIYGRNLISGVAVRIEKDLVVVTGERACEYFDCSEQTRVYFDKNRAYFFKKNAITGEWEADDFFERLTNSESIRHRKLDKDIFDNTCVEEYAGFSI